MNHIILYTQQNGEDVPVLTIKHLVNFGSGSEGSIEICRITKVENLDLILHTRDLQVDALIAIKKLTSVNQVVNYRHQTRTPQLVSTQVASINKTSDNHGFVNHYCEYLHMYTTDQRNDQQQTKQLVLIMQFVPFTLQDVIANGPGKVFTYQDRQYLRNQNKNDSQLSSFWTESYPSGILRIDSKILQASPQVLEQRTLLATCFIDSLATCLHRFHLLDIGPDKSKANHRDLRLSNLGVLPSSDLVLLDIGWTLLTDDTKTANGLSGTLSFNPCYNSPRIIHFIKNKQEVMYGSSDDWFQLTVSICKLLTGFFPFLPVPIGGQGLPGDPFSHNILQLEKIIKNHLSNYDPEQAFQIIKESSILEGILHPDILTVLNFYYNPDFPIETYGSILLLLSCQLFDNDQQRALALLWLGVFWRAYQNNQTSYLVQQLTPDTSKLTVYKNGKLAQVGMYTDTGSTLGPLTTDAFAIAGDTVFANYDPSLAAHFSHLPVSPLYLRAHYQNGLCQGTSDLKEPACTVFTIPDPNMDLLTYYKFLYQTPSFQLPLETWTQESGTQLRHNVVTPTFSKPAASFTEATLQQLCTVLQNLLDDLLFAKAAQNDSLYQKVSSSLTVARSLLKLRLANNPISTSEISEAANLRVSVQTLQKNVISYCQR